MTTTAETCSTCGHGLEEYCACCGRLYACGVISVRCTTCGELAEPHREDLDRFDGYSTDSIAALRAEVGDNRPIRPLPRT